MEILSNTTHLECLQYNPCVYSHLRSPGLGLCYLLDFRKADLRCGGVAISWAFTFLPPWKPDSLLCLLCIHFPLPSHLPTARWGFLFSCPGAQSPGAPVYPASDQVPGAVEAGCSPSGSPGFVCWSVCLRARTAGGRDPRGGVASSQNHPGGLDTSSPLAAALICSVSWRWPA